MSEEGSDGAVDDDVVSVVEDEADMSCVGAGVGVG